MYFNVYFRLQGRLLGRQASSFLKLCVVTCYCPLLCTTYTINYYMTWAFGESIPNGICHIQFVVSKWSVSKNVQVYSMWYRNGYLNEGQSLSWQLSLSGFHIWISCQVNLNSRKQCHKWKIACGQNWFKSAKPNTTAGVSINQFIEILRSTQEVVCRSSSNWSLCFINLVIQPIW